MVQETVRMEQGVKVKMAETLEILERELFFSQHKNYAFECKYCNFER